jgi:hypothetical protein
MLNSLQGTGALQHPKQPTLTTSYHLFPFDLVHCVFFLNRQLPITMDAVRISRDMRRATIQWSANDIDNEVEVKESEEVLAALKPLLRRELTRILEYVRVCVSVCVCV